MVFAAIGRIAKEHPFKFGCIFSAAKTSFSDWLVQTTVEKRQHIDWKRNATFGVFGLFYLGGVQYSIYVPLFSRLFPGAAAYSALPLSAKLKDVVGTRNMLTQVFLDQFVHHPLMYFPCFYCLKEVVNGGQISGGLDKYKQNYQEDLIALWKLWVPSTIINFAFMPMHMRIPWVASTSLIWTCILSYMRGDSDIETSADAAMDYTGGSQGKPLQALYDLGVAGKPSYLYDKSKAHMLVTATGRDRIGFVSELSTVIASLGGNILDAKMYKVGREFVTILLVESWPTVAKQMTADLVAINGMQVSVQQSQPWHGEADSMRCKDGVCFMGRLEAAGTDSPGVLQRITGLLSNAGLDVTTLSCTQHCQNSLGTNELQNVFQITGIVRAFVEVDQRALKEQLVQLESETGIRIGIQETYVDESFSAFGSPDRQPSRLVKTRSNCGTPRG
mmetsp:Transcript_62253/g.103458  ORF Transcript_62253/g.103458 Transcript_62253/m.103458 type:complete len:445 (-) Transcript_62253:146-1480(-)